jgi:tyrosyl-tRNA synthetase
MMPAEVDALREACRLGERHPRELKAELGRRIVSDFHSQAEAKDARDEFDRVFRERQLPEDIPTADRPAGAIKLVKLLAAEGLAQSVSEAQRLVSQGSVRLNGQPATDVTTEVSGDAGHEALIQVGKRRFLRVLFKSAG